MLTFIMKDSNFFPQFVFGWGFCLFVKTIIKSLHFELNTEIPKSPFIQNGYKFP